MAKVQWTDVKRPLGALLPNWPMAVGLGFSVVLITGLLLTSEEPIVDTSDPLAGRLEPDIDATLDTGSVDRLAAGIAQDAQRRADSVAAVRQQALQESTRRQRDERLRAAENERRYRDALGQLEVLRARPNQPTLDVGMTDALAGSADEAALLQVIRLEEIQRQSNAFRAPMVASSARGIGERAHVLDRPEIMASVPGGSVGRPAVPRRPVGAPGPPTRARPRTTPGVPPGVAATPGVAPLVQGPGAPLPVVGQVPPPANAQVPGQFGIGPRADGGLGSPGPVGVVVSPDDGSHYRLYEGTLIPAVLQTQLNGSFSGPLSAQVTRPVYSRDRQRILVPRGTIVLGTSGTVSGPFQGRLAIAFHRMVFPDGRWVLLDFAGLNSLGESSLKDLVDNHYLATFGTAGAIGMLAGFTAASSGSGEVRSAMSEQMASMALTMMQRFLNRPPDITIRAGHGVNVRLMSDVVIPDYAVWQAQ